MMICTSGDWAEGTCRVTSLKDHAAAGPRRGLRAALVVVAALLAAAVLASRTSDRGPADASETLFSVTRGGDVLASWSTERIESELAMVELTADGDDLRGPSLRVLLAASGVERWSRLSVVGQGQGRGFEVALDVESADVDETWVLSFTRRGDLRLAAPALARERWVRGVSEIEVVE
jgi:hypothetical protein